MPSRAGVVIIVSRGKFEVLLLPVEVQDVGKSGCCEGMDVRWGLKRQV